MPRQPCSHANAYATNKEYDYLAVAGRRGASEADAKLAPFERRALAGAGGARLAAVAAVPAAVAEPAVRRALLAAAAPAEPAPALRAEGAEGDAPLAFALRTTAPPSAPPFGALRGRAARDGGGLPAGAALLLAGAPPG